MKAFLNDGRGLGSEHSDITNEYKSLKTLYRYAVIPFLKFHGGFCRAEIFLNWDNRYGVPDIIKIWEEKINGRDNLPNYCHPIKCSQCDSAIIHGVYCHSDKCPNINKIWNRIDGIWENIDIR